MRRSTVALAVGAGLVVSLLSPAYWVVYTAFLLGTSAFMLVRDQLVRLFSGFFLLYFGIACLNVVEYRGMLTAETTRVFASFTIFALVVLSAFAAARSRLSRRSRPRRTFESTRLLQSLLLGHVLLTVGATLAAAMLYGNILIDQEARFFIPASLQYLIKSGAVVPLIYFGASNSRFTPRNILLFGLAPLLPVLFVGGRGVAIVSVLSVLIFFRLRESDLDRWSLPVPKRLPSRRVLSAIGALGAVVVYGFFFLRRSSSQYLVGFSELYAIYFRDIPYWLAATLAPVYTALRETAGLTQTIVDRGLANELTPYPLFVADMVTVLPGPQVAAGNALSTMTGGNDGAGLTPGIVGGLYLDFGALTWLAGGIVAATVGGLYLASWKSDHGRVVLAYVVGQALHLVHRGFFKPEYLTGLVIIIGYLILSRRVDRLPADNISPTVATP